MEIESEKKLVSEPEYDSAPNAFQYYQECCEYSFHKNQWRLQFPTQQQQLIDAGFCYLPTKDFADCVYCYICNLHLVGWDSCEDPYEAHLRVSPDCEWLEERQAEIVQATKFACGRCPSKYPSNNKLHTHIREYHAQEPTQASTPTCSSPSSAFATPLIEFSETTPTEPASPAIETAPFDAAASSTATSVEPSSLPSSKGPCEESSREPGCTTPGLTSHASTKELGSIGSQVLIDGLSPAQAAGIKAYINGQVESEMQRQATSLEERLYQKMQGSTEELISLLTKHHNMTPQALQQTINESNSEISTSTVQPTPASSIASTDLPTPIRPEEVGYFDPDYQPERGMITPVVSVGKFVWFLDVYMFVNRLKSFVAQGKDIKSIITSCLRGSALMWYLMELSEEDCAALRNDAGLENWYKLLIGRFKIDTCTALDRIFSPAFSYTLACVKRTPPRVWVHRMLHLAKSAGFDSDYSQLCLLRSRLDWEIRRDIPMPKPDTSITAFLEDMEGHLSTWLELADRQSSYDQLPQFQHSSPLQQQDHYGAWSSHPENGPINDRVRWPYSSGMSPTGHCTDY